MYRPKGWKNPNDVFHNALDGIYSVQDAEYEAYEAGADAILESLCTVENRMVCIDQYGNDKPKNVKGWLVFIPESEQR